MSDEGVLVAHDPADWAQLSEVLTGFECAWEDVDGWQEGPCPQLEPVGATHLWGWKGDRVVLVRLGGSSIVCAELKLGESTTTGDHEMAVRVASHDAGVWADGENGVAVRSRHAAFELLAAEGVSTVWFVRPR